MQRLPSIGLSAILSPFLNTILYTPLSLPIPWHRSTDLLWPGKSPDSWSLSVYLGSSSAEFSPFLDISKPCLLSTAWHSSAKNLLIFSKHQSSHRSQIGGSLSLSKDLLVISLFALALCIVMKSTSDCCIPVKTGISRLSCHGVEVKI